MSNDETPPQDHQPPSFVSSTEAAKIVGVSKPTMGRYLAKGRVSYRKAEHGDGYQIDMADLARAFPDEVTKWLQQQRGETPETGELKQPETGNATHETPNQNEGLRVEVKMLREMLANAKLDLERERRAASEAIDDYRNRLDQADSERRALSIQLLTFTQPPAPPPSDPAPSPTTPTKGGILGWFRKAS